MLSIKNQHRLREMEAAIAKLQEQVAELEARLEAKRGPGRPRKDEAERQSA